MILNRAWAVVASSGVASNPLVALEVTGTKVGAHDLAAGGHGPSSMDSGTWYRCLEITCIGSKMYVRPVEEQFSGATFVRRSNSKSFPPNSVHPDQLVAPHPITTTEAEVVARRGCGRLRSGLRRVRSTKMTSTFRADRHGLRWIGGGHRHRVPPPSIASGPTPVARRLVSFGLSVAGSV
jgi:hypothetical protein